MRFLIYREAGTGWSGNLSVYPLAMVYASDGVAALDAFYASEQSHREDVTAWNCHARGAVPYLCEDATDTTPVIGKPGA